MAKILVTEDGVQRDFPLDGTLSFGRSAENNVTLGETLASRKHFIIRQSGAGFEIEDLGSRNGTFVNGERLNGKRVLALGDKVTIGKALIVLSDAPLSGPAPLSPSLDDEVQVFAPDDLDEAAPKNPVISPPPAAPAQRSRKQSITSTVRMTGTPFLALVTDLTTRYSLHMSPAIFGRKKTCTYPIETDGISGMHCQVEQINGGYVLTDLGSTNGTLHNKARITGPVTLKSGDAVQIGGQKLIYFDPAGGGSLEGALLAMEAPATGGSARSIPEMVLRSTLSKSNALPVTMMIIAALALVVVALRNWHQAATPPGVTAIAGNLMGLEVSFESDAEMQAWDTAALTGATLQRDTLEAASGTASLRLAKSGLEPAVLPFHRAIDAAPGSAFLLQLRAKADHVDGHFGAVALWHNVKGEEIGRSFSDFIQGGSEQFQNIATTVTAPPQTARMIVACYFDGTAGTVWVDDIGVTSAPAAGTGTLQNPLPVYVSENGMLTVFEKDKAILRDLQAEIQYTEKSPLHHAIAQMDHSRTTRGKDHVELAGTMQSSAGGSAEFRVAVFPAGDGSLRYHHRLLAADAEILQSYRLTCRVDAASVPAVAASAAVQEFLWQVGGRQLLVTASLPVRVESTTHDGSATVAFVPDLAAVKQAGLDWSLFFKPIPASAQEQLTALQTELRVLDRGELTALDASAGWQERYAGIAYGKAFELYRRMEKEFFFLPAVLRQAQARQHAIAAMLVDLRAAADEFRKDAEAFGILSDYAAARERYACIRALFAGMPASDDTAVNLAMSDLDARIESGDRAIAQRLTEQRDQDAAYLYSLAEAEAKARRPASARAFCQEILLRFPETTWSEKAQALLDKVR